MQIQKLTSPWWLGGERPSEFLRVAAPAKVNLFLEVLARRPDGYHAIETLMVAISLYDTLDLAAAETLTLVCDRPDLSVGPDNLVLRAARLLQEQTGCTAGARMVLSKRIPIAAGLAGGSANAAAALVGLNELWQLRLPAEALAALAGRLGSDVPFFLGRPAAWCTGRGEIITPETPGQPLHLVVAAPPQGLSTAEVYRGVEVPAEPVSGEAIRAALRAGDNVQVGRLLHNRLQASAERISVAVTELCRLLERLDVLGARMSGSGSSVFGVCRDRRDALRVASQLSAQLAAGAAHSLEQTRVIVVQSVV
jgi:4-diphosphocytidyl-2-C-methyl-D-erythritol kinase